MYLVISSFVGVAQVGDAIILFRARGVCSNALGRSMGQINEINGVRRSMGSESLILRAERGNVYL